MSAQAQTPDQKDPAQNTHKDVRVAETLDRSKTHVISLLVHDRPGVLVRIALVFSRRGYNVESLVVSRAMYGNFSRMTITVEGDPETLDQIVRQLNKLVDVIHATEHIRDNVVERELALVKLAATDDTRHAALQIIEHFKGKTVDITDSTLSVQIAGNADKIDAFLRMAEKHGLIEVVRTGKIWMARGEEAT